MIANSQPYNPSQRIGWQQSNASATSSNKMMTTSQQNSIYGQMQAPSRNSQAHLLDLPNSTTTTTTSAFDQQQLDNLAVQSQQRLRSSKRNNTQQHRSASNNTSTDMSLYSPSSSTSLLYHIYDQINVPTTNSQTNDSQPQLINNRQLNQVPKSSTTILNPANLFGGQQQQQQLQPTYLYGGNANGPQPIHFASDSNSYESRQQLMIDSMLRHQTQTLARQHNQPTMSQQHQSGTQNNRPLSSSGVSSLSNQSSSTQLAYGRQPRGQQIGGKFHYGQQTTASGAGGLFAQPLNPIGLMSTSATIGHGNGFIQRDGFSSTQTHSSLTPTPPSDQSTCYMQHQLNSRLSLTNLSHHHQHTINNNNKRTTYQSVAQSAASKDPFIRAAATGAPVVSSAAAGSSGSSPTNRWKQVPNLPTDWHKVFQMSPNNKRAARTLVSEHKSLIQWSILLILLALSLVSILKFISAPQQATSNPLSSSSPNSNNRLAEVVSSTAANSVTTNAALNVAQQNLIAQQRRQQQHNTISSGNNAAAMLNLEPSQTGSANSQTSANLAQLNFNSNPTTLQTQTQTQTQTQQTNDVLTSRLLIGEFVIVSQNYSQQTHSQRALLTERLVKLLDQVFLASDVRRFYARTEITNLRPNAAALSGTVVDCNIVLTDSIAYAAQQFGIALYDALAKSNGRLANQVGYVIDKNTIRFNTVPDKDFRAGLVPLSVIAPSVRRELEAYAIQSSSSAPLDSMATPIDDPMDPQSANLNGNPMEQQMNSVVWSEWSQWSSCIDKNGICDPLRLHSRLRKCVAQHTGEKVDVGLCKKRFNAHDLELEVQDCASTCRAQQPLLMQLASPTGSINQPPTADQLPAHTSAIMSDAPIMLAMGPNGPDAAASAASPTAPAAGPQLTALLGAMQHQQQQQRQSSVAAAISRGLGLASDSDAALYTPPSAALGGQTPAPAAQVSLQASPAAASGSSSDSASSAAAAAAADSVSAGAAGSARQQQDLAQLQIQLQQQQQQQQLTCSNCTSGEICLLLMTQKVPFCAKIKDRQDECGGWCKAQSQLCQSMGANAFKCIHDSECLEGEWRCHDSACIPESKRCDGHSNCYDNSDERDCPVAAVPAVPSGAPAAQPASSSSSSSPASSSSSSSSSTQSQSAPSSSAQSASATSVGVNGAAPPAP